MVCVVCVVCVLMCLCSVWCLLCVLCLCFVILLLRHAPLHYVTLHSGFPLIQVYVIGSFAVFLFLVV